MLEIIKYIFMHGAMPSSWKDTYIVLLPKKSNAERVNDFRPISLCNTIYKIIAKILVARLKHILSSLVAN